MKIDQDIKSKLEKLKPILKERYQVKTIGFFGSYARAEQNQKSDIDIFDVFVKELFRNNIDFHMQFAFEVST